MVARAGQDAHHRRDRGAASMASRPAPCLRRFGSTAWSIWAPSDVERRSRNVIRWNADAKPWSPVLSGTRTPEGCDERGAAHWVTMCTHVLLHRQPSPSPTHPYPIIVRDFRRDRHRNAPRRCRKPRERLPDSLIACIGGGSNAMGLFHPFPLRSSVEISFRQSKQAGHGLNAIACGLESRGAPGVSLHISNLSVADD